MLDIVLALASVCLLPCHSINDLFIALWSESSSSDHCLRVLIYQVLVVQ